MYHGTRVWAPRHTPELMLGVYSEEEFDEPKKRPTHNPNTGEITESPGDDPTPNTAADAAPGTPHASGAALSIEDMARESAKLGEDIFNEFYKQRSRDEKALINAIGAELRRT